MAESHKENNITKYYTFLDGDEFTANWGFEEDSCEKEAHLRQKGIISRNENTVKTSQGENILDVVDRHEKLSRICETASFYEKR